MAQQQMGIGPLGFNNIIFKRKFRYTFTVQNICNKGITMPPFYVKTSARPHLAIEETEINYLNAKIFIPGKATWETITVTYIDVVDQNNIAYFKPLWDWLASVYNFTDPINLQMGSRGNDYTAQGILNEYDGCGTLLNTWTLNRLWPTDINFGEVDYASSEECTIELTLRYSDVIYTPVCPNFAIQPCCTPCGS